MHREYSEYLWWVMHHSDDPDRQTLAVTCYLDESGTDSHNPQAVVAGILFNKQNFMYFEDQWVELLSRYQISPPLHMNEFVEKGRFGHIRYKDRFNFFSEAVDLINNCKIYSIAATLNKQEYEGHIHKEIRKSFSVYGFCFMLLAYINGCQARYMHFKEKIAYLFDNGAQHKNHIIVARDRILEWEKDQAFANNMGSLTFDGDVKISTLQAADIVAWGARRKISNIALHKGFEPIGNLFNAEHHLQYGWDSDFLKNFAQEINKIVGREDL